MMPRAIVFGAIFDAPLVAPSSEPAARRSDPSECRAAPEQELWTCPSCAAAHELHRHDVAGPNSGSLTCPQCGREFIKWAGSMRYTIAVADPVPV